MKKLNLLTRLLLAIALGVFLGKVADATTIKVLATFNSLFGDFLKFCVPLILLGFVTPGIANLERSAGKLLFITAILAYTSTVLSGFLAYQINSFTFPFLLDTASNLAYFDNPEDALQSTFFKINNNLPFKSLTLDVSISFCFGMF